MARKLFKTTMEEKDITMDEAKEGFELALNQAEFLEDYSDKLIDLFEYAIKYNQGLFVSLHHNQEVDNVEASKSYFVNWIQRYVNERAQPSSEKQLKTYMQDDPALSTRVAKVTGAVQEDLEKYSYGHAIYMSAENHNGGMLEEYIASILEPLGWIWCAGSTFKSTDFCYLNYDDINDQSILLQVKNKYNSENSSSSAIREGTTIEKWNRLKSPLKSNPSKPRPNWDKLQEIILESTLITELVSESEIKNATKLLDEEHYLKYIRENSNIELDELQSDKVQ